MSGAVDYLRQQPSVKSQRVGVIGFCMGGGLALVLATQRPDAIGACVPYYGIIPWETPSPTGRSSTRRCCGHFAENDGFFTPDKAPALEAQLQASARTPSSSSTPASTTPSSTTPGPRCTTPRRPSARLGQTLSFLRGRPRLSRSAARPRRSTATSSSGCGSVATSTASSTPTTGPGRSPPGSPPSRPLARRRRWRPTPAPLIADLDARRGEPELGRPTPALAAGPGRRAAHSAAQAGRRDDLLRRRGRALLRRAAPTRARRERVRRGPPAPRRGAARDGSAGRALVAWREAQAIPPDRLRAVIDSLADDFRERTDRHVRPARRRAHRLGAGHRQAVVGLQLLPRRPAQPGGHQHRPAGAGHVDRPPRRPRGLPGPPHRALPQGGRPGAPAGPPRGDDLPGGHAAVPAGRGPGRPRPRGARWATRPSRSWPTTCGPLGVRYDAEVVAAVAVAGEALDRVRGNVAFAAARARRLGRRRDRLRRALGPAAPRPGREDRSSS